MNRLTDPEYLLTDQYRDASKLKARIDLHARFSINTYDWFLWVFDWLDPPPRGRILELGCGPGDLWLKNLPRIPEGWKVTLSDFSVGMAHKARQNLHAHQRFTIGIIDAQAIPFEDETFDVVIANHMLYHVPRRSRALAEVRRVLKPGGRVYATTVGEQHLQEIPALLAKFDPALADRYRDEKNEFTLESGGAQLAEWFSDVTLHRYEDDLLVREAAPLVDYITSSVRLGLGVDRHSEFTSFIQRELTSNQGVLRITKDSGIFIAARRS